MKLRAAISCDCPASEVDRQYASPGNPVKAKRRKGFNCRVLSQTSAAASLIIPEIPTQKHPQFEALEFQD
ncbi:MAG: hypothetical protein AUJ92_06715 [Armatimonadetes bacterium CG2_30_59_28]|nr:MAG: hypothetical protein AUJ92_06715 [Armatimonadetes bacterium CG2_30_59_28]